MHTHTHTHTEGRNWGPYCLILLGAQCGDPTSKPLPIRHEFTCLHFYGFMRARRSKRVPAKPS